MTFIYFQFKYFLNYHLLFYMSHYENLAIEGGGVKGIAYIGVFQALIELDKLKDFN